jgi:hypothetical protein
MAEKREARRRSVRSAGRLLLQPSHEIEVRLLDISSRGIGLVASVNLPAGTTGTLQFGVPGPDARPIPFEARVAVADCVLSGADQGFRIGMQFSGEPGGPLKLAIEVFVEAG